MQLIQQQVLKINKWRNLFSKENTPQNIAMLVF